jgi:transcriptional regulator with XRE-family HTH domain
MKRICDTNKRLRELIVVLGISQIELCEKADIKPSALSNYLHGNRMPRTDVIVKIIDAYKLNPSWIMGYDAPMYSEQ